ncbi:MAG: GNAT family N-acetyltransferase [Sphingomonas sp.]|uniref:GNAT family N-acetyltransferase n=1 Tax=Sphingomonas sp. TaxID=28214 RepID=UPI001AC63FEB|nr:GNAT family N-acetyltransferase [Sphingomonas sp.]MBN8814276.1 GNAT family N-acetyltransferase [Sphingomonas sp.]
MFAITPRLVLRPGWPEDAPALARAIAHKSVVTKLSRVPWPYGQGDAEAFLADAWQGSVPRFVITERARDDRPIGCIGLHHDHDLPELGYWLTPEVWGRGYATEAGNAVVALARDSLRLPRLRASWLAGNPASGRVLSKLGFVATGRVVPQPSRALGHDVDTVEMLLDFDADEPRMPIAA